ncbi:MAG TPA: type IV pilus modification protein PilV [Gammaproteobacteria bacterium]
MQRERGRFPTGHRGFSLIEVMVALLVLSVGLLGIAALHGQGLGASRVAMYRTVAVNLAADMAERIRVNRLGGGAYGGSPADNECDPQTGSGVDCTPAEMAAHDLFVWQEQVAEQLPNGSGEVQFAAGTPPTYTITVTWDETGIGETSYTTTIEVPDI